MMTQISEADICKLRQSLIKYCLSYSLTASEADDIAQESLARYLERFAEIEHPESWLIRVARNLMFDVFRKPRMLPLSDMDTDSLCASRGMVSSETEFDRIEAANLCTALATGERDLCQLTIVQGYQDADLALLLGTSIEAAKTRRQRMLIHLRHELGPRWQWSECSESENICD